MKTASNITLIAVRECCDACSGEPDLEERARKAMRAASNFWISMPDNEKFQAALAAVLIETRDPAQKARLDRSVDMAKAVSAMLQAGAADDMPDLDKIMDVSDGFEPLPLVGMWIDEGKRT